MPTFEPPPEVVTSVPIPRIVGWKKADWLSNRSAGVSFWMSLRVWTLAVISSAG